MQKSSPLLIKTCISCGLQKPLSAFIQLAGNKGTTYGNICSNCRKTQSNHAESTQEQDEGTSRTRLSYTIGAEERLAAEIFQKEQVEKKEEDYHKEREKESKLQDKKTQLIETKTQNEIRHRDSYLRKGSFLSDSKKITDPLAIRRQAEQEAAISAQAIFEEREKEVNFDAPVDVMRVSKISRDGVLLKALAARLGPGSPFSRALTSEAAKKTAQPTSTTLNETEKQQEIVDYVNRKWGGPKPRR